MPPPTSVRNSSRRSQSRFVLPEESRRENEKKSACVNA